MKRTKSIEYIRSKINKLDINTGLVKQNYLPLCSEKICDYQTIQNDKQETFCRQKQTKKSDNIDKVKVKVYYSIFSYQKIYKQS